MAEQETSFKHSRETPIVSIPESNLCQDSSLAPGSSEELGESRNNNIENQEHKYRNKLVIGALDNIRSNSFLGDTEGGIARIGGCRDLESPEGQRSGITEKDAQVYELVPSASIDILESVLRQAASRFITGAPSRERKDADQILSSFLSKQLGNLTAKESEGRLGQERIEHVVEQVQAEVEFEQVINEIWFNVRADYEAQEMERRERNFEVDTHEVQLEDEVGMLQGKVRRLEDELRLTHTHKTSALQTKQDEMDDIIHSVVGDMRVEARLEDAAADGGSLIPNDSELTAVTSNLPAVASPEQAAFLAFRDTMKEAAVETKQDLHVIQSRLLSTENLENVFHQEQQRSHEKEQRLESWLLAMKKEVSKISGVLRETELALSVEQERRKEACLEVDQVLETWKEEKTIRVECEDKVKRLLSFMLSIKEKLTTGEDDKEDVTSRLASVSKDLDNKLQRMSSKKLSTRKSKLMDVEQSTRWKSQRDAAVAERDSLEEKLNLQLRRARDRESEIEAMWVERERNLITRCSHLEAAIVHWESKFKKRDFELVQERKLSEIDLEAHRKQWADEKTDWEGFMLKREQWLEEQVANWTSLLDIKDCELDSLKKELEELETSLKNRKQAFENPSQQVYNQQEQMLEASSPSNLSCEVYKAGRSSEDSEGESCQNVEDFAHEIETEEDEHDAEPDLGTGTIDKLGLENKELQEKVSNTLTLMDELRSDFQNRLNKFDDEKKNLEVGLSSKSVEVEDLVAQLNSRDRQIDVLMQKFRDEVSSIDREVEKERKERERVMEMHFVGKRRLVAEIREKEENWQNDLDSITQELLESREWSRKKDEEIFFLKEDLQALDERITAEEQRLSNRIESLIEERDELMAALKQEQKLRVEAEAEYQRLEEEHITLLENLSAERQKNKTEPNARYTNCWEDADLQTAVCRVTNVDEQIAEAMAEVESLKEELDTKDAQLEQARIDKEAEREERQPALAQEYKEILDMREQQLQQLWMLKEQELLSANDKILHQLAAERGETAIVQGALRELEWSINHGNTDLKSKLRDISKTEGMVKVHTSHLEEMDQYILDLQQKLEELEKKRKSADIAASVRELKRAASLDVALVQGDRDTRLSPNAVRHDGYTLSHLSFDSGTEGLQVRTRSPIGDKSGRGDLSSIRETQPGSYLEGEISSSAGRHGGNISSCTSYGQPRNDYSPSVLPPVSPGRRQQKWLVDVAWLENVRKEQSFLRQQLDSERQRVYSFGQIEAENRLIEAAVARAMEEKYESESKVLDLQQEIREHATVIIELMNCSEMSGRWKGHSGSGLCNYSSISDVYFMRAGAARRWPRYRQVLLVLT